MKMRSVSVVITTWNNAASIERCLEALSPQLYGEVLLCDCGSSDSTIQLARQVFPGVRVLAEGYPLSLAQARNLGLTRASGETVLLLEGDWEVPPGCVELLQEVLLSNPEVALAVPRFEDADGTPQIGHNVRRFPTTAALVLELTVLHKLAPGNRATRRYRMTDFDHAYGCMVDHACGAVILARRARLLDLGGYDERYAPAWMEDVEIGRRLAANGWKTAFAPRAQACHLGRETTRHFLIENRYDEFYCSVLVYAREHLGAGSLLVRLALIVGMFERIFLSYALPGRIRRSLISAYRIYNSDEAIQSYKHMYWKALVVAWKGLRNVPPGKSPEATGRLFERPACGKEQAGATDA